MRTLSALIYVTTLLVFMQLLTGGLVTLYGLPSGHALLGVIVAILALASTATAFVSKPAYPALRFSCLTVLLLIVLAGLTPQKEIAFLHYTLALLAFGTLMIVIFFSVRWSHMI